MPRRGVCDFGADGAVSMSRWVTGSRVMHIFASGGRVMHIFASNPVKGAPPPDCDVAAALTALVSIGCSLTQPDERGITPLDWAARTGNAPVVRALLAMGAPADTENLTHAVHHPDVMQLLQAARARQQAGS